MLKENLHTYFPIIKVLQGTTASSLKRDALAGLTAGVVLIPQGMAYAVIAGLPPIYGLYAGLIPLFIYPIFGTSRHLSIGPVALDMIVLASGLVLLAGDDLSQKVTFAIMITMMTGIFQILMGYLKLGFVFNLFSRPVISGFTIAAPVIIIFSQLGTLFKMDLPNTQFIHEIVYYLIQHPGEIHIPTLLLSCFFILFLVIGKMKFKRVPMPMLLLLLTLAGIQFLDLGQWDINKLGDIPKGLPGLALPDIFDIGNLRGIAATAFTLSLIQFMTVASLSKSFARKYGYAVEPNQELKAIGSSNLIGSFFQSIPVSASFSRSAIVEQSGGKSILTNYFAGGLILLTLLFLTPLFEDLPTPLLGAIIVVSVSGLIDIREIHFLFSTKRRDALVAMITFLSVLIIGIQEGIIIGIVGSMLAILIKMSKPTVAELGLMPGSRNFRNLERNSEAIEIPGVLILRIDASFSFVNAHFFKNFIIEKSLERPTNPKYVIIDGSTIGDLDISAIDTLLMIIDTLDKHDIELYVSGLIGPVRDVIRKSDIHALVRSDRFFDTVHDAVEAALKKQDLSDKGSRFSDYDNNSA